MKKLDFIIFFSIVLTFYTIINSYIFARGLKAIPNDSIFKTSYIIIFWFLVSAFIAGRFLERVNISWFSSSLVWIGSFWIGAMIYLLLIVLCIDVFRIINHFFHFFPSFIFNDYEKTKRIIALGAIAIVTSIVIIGYINALSLRTISLNLSIPKNANGLKEIRIAAVSDIHLGTLVSNSRLEKIVNKINNLNADLVLLPGDVIDEDIGPVVKQNLGETLRKIKSKFGVYSVTGNHEYIGGVEEAAKYLLEHGVTVIRDSAIKIENGFYLIGREDASINQFTGKKRKTLNEIVKNLDRILPLILMDHQPLRLEEAEANGIDLQLSGHTHHGQFFPINLITKKVYELSWGYKKKGNTHYYISCGVGTWGPPIRIANRPEIINLKIEFQN